MQDFIGKIIAIVNTLLAAKTKSHFLDPSVASLKWSNCFMFNSYQKQFAIRQVLGFLCEVLVLFFSINRFRHVGNFSIKGRFHGSLIK